MKKTEFEDLQRRNFPTSNKNKPGNKAARKQARRNRKINRNR